MEVWNIYLLFLFLLGALFVTGAVIALRWALRDGQFKDLDRGANVIFTNEEPEGVTTDRFPGDGDDFSPHKS